jgi:hypothetical protein
MADQSEAVATARAHTSGALHILVLAGLASMETLGTPLGAAHPLSPIGDKAGTASALLGLRS